MQAGRTAHQKSQTRRTGSDQAVRGANTIDRYSLALQLIQVWPIILEGVAFVVTIQWLRILLALTGLLSWTVWAVFRERAATPVRPRAREDAPSIESQLAEATATVARTAHGIRIAIWLDPEGAVPHEHPRHHARGRQGSPRSHRTGSTPTQRVHRAITDDPEPSDGASSWRSA